MKTKNICNERFIKVNRLKSNHKSSFISPQFLVVFLLMCCLSANAIAQSSEGIDFYSFEQRRLQVGRNDDNDDGKPDYPLNPNMLATHGLRNESILLKGDTIEVTLKGRVVGSGTYSYIYLVDNADIEYQIIYDNFPNAYYDIYPHAVTLNGSPSSITAVLKNDYHSYSTYPYYYTDCPYPHYNYYNNYNYNFTWGWELYKSDATPFNAGDEIKVVLRYVIDIYSYYFYGSVWNNRHFEMFATDHQLYDMNEIVDPYQRPPVVDSYTTEIQGYDLEFYTNYTGNRLEAYGQGTYTHSGTGSLNFNYLPVDAFPYEYRPLYSIDSIVVTSPPGWILENSQTFTLVTYDVNGIARTCTIGLTASSATSATPYYKVFRFDSAIFAITGNSSGDTPPFVPPSGYFYLEQLPFNVFAAQPLTNSETYGYTTVYTTGLTDYYSSSSTYQWTNFYQYNGPVSNNATIHVNRNSTINGYTPTQLVENILMKGANCSSISNVSFTAHGWNGSSWTNTDNRGLGYFTKGESDFEFSEGLVLSTGGLSSIEGPNYTESGIYYPSGAVTTTDSDLIGLNPNVRNASILQFDFVPIGNVIQLRYVFASEEYMNANNDDLFGIFISGPGISGKENIAKLPTTTSGSDQISVRNVNHGLHSCWEGCPDPAAGVNPAYYLNIPGNYHFEYGDCPTVFTTAEDASLYQSMQFNGRTVVLTASATVTPCQTYTLKLALANVYNQDNQSGVFLEARSFDTGDNLVNYGNGIEGMDIVYRGCATNKFVVHRADANVSSPATVNLTYGGTAVNGVDVSSSGGALPPSVTIPAGQQSAAVSYTVNTPPAGTATFTINGSCPCSGAGYTKTIYIYDKSPDTDFDAIPTPSCSGRNSGKISITTGTAGSGHYESSIDGGLSWQSSLLDHTGLAPGSYTVHVRDTGSCHSVALVRTITAQPFTVNAGPDQSLCSREFTMAAQPLGFDEIGVWSIITGSADIYDSTNPNTTLWLYSETATLRWSLYTPDCQANDEVILTSLLNMVNSQYITGPSAICVGTSTTLTNASTHTKTWRSDNPAIASISGSGSSVTMTGASVGSTSIWCIIEHNGCKDSVSRVVTINALPVINLPVTPPTGCDGNSVTFTATVSSGSTTYNMTYTWNIAGATYTSTSATYTRAVAVSSTYSVSVTNGNGCNSGFTAPQPVIVAPTVVPTIVISANNNNFCAGNSVTLSAVVTNEGSAPAYRWRRNGSNIPLATALTCTYIPAAGDVFTCVLNSSAACANPNPVTSNAVTLTVLPTETPVGTITATPN